jgi:hypothetical protein
MTTARRESKPSLPTGSSEKVPPPQPQQVARPVLQSQFEILSNSTDESYDHDRASLVSASASDISDYDAEALLRKNW